MIFLYVVFQASAGYQYVDPYYGGVIATYGGQAMVGLTLVVHLNSLLCSINCFGNRSDLYGWFIFLYILSVSSSHGWASSQPYASALWHH